MSKMYAASGWYSLLETCQQLSNKFYNPVFPTQDCGLDCAPPAPQNLIISNQLGWIGVTDKFHPCNVMDFARLWCRTCITWVS